MRTAVLFILAAGAGLAFGDVDPALVKKAQEAAVIIRTPLGGGSGALVSLDGATYIVTNQHVLEGSPAADVHIKFPDGSPAYPVAAEISADDTDVLRLKIASSRPALRCNDADPALGSEVVAIGNSLDAGVVTINPGHILGVGPSELEVDCEFVPGNSGGPLIDKTGQIIGLPAYLRLIDGVAGTEGTRYSKPRRFCVRVHDGMKWIPIANWPQYASIGKSIASAESVYYEVAAVAKAIATNENVSALNPRQPLVNDAIRNYQQLCARVNKMSGQYVTSNQLNQNNNTLGSVYCVTFQKLRDACASSIKDLNFRPIPKEWAWLEKRRKEVLAALEEMAKAADAESKNRPRFLNFY